MIVWVVLPLGEPFGSDPFALQDQTSELEARRPASEPILEYLRKDHGEILEMVSALNQRLQELDPSDPRIQQGRRAFLEKIRSHERIENRLVRDTYMLDEGGLG